VSEPDYPDVAMEMLGSMPDRNLHAMDETRYISVMYP